MRTGIVLLAASLLAAGCTSLADRIAQPQTDLAESVEDVREMDRALGVIQASIQTTQGNRIAYRMLSAADYRMVYRYARTSGGGNMELDFVQHSQAGKVAGKGSIVFLHGWSMDGSTLLPWAMAFASHGYRAVLPDLRNHGASSRAPAGYGPREAQDMAELVAQLRNTGVLTEPVYLFGLSYGAATAIFAADRIDPPVAGVVALAPYANAGAGIRSLIEGMRSSSGGGTGMRLLRAYAKHGYDKAAVDHAVGKAGTQLELDLDSIDVASALRRSTVCTLLLHGARDKVIPVDVARGLAQTTGVRYAELPQEGHLTLPLRIDWLAEPIAEWIRNVEQCPQIRLPADPLGPFVQ